MLREPPNTGRPNKTESLTCDLVVVGGGLAGVCCAITAAREGLKVVLVNDRPVLGGNASSEVRLWVLGATAHMGNNNRWAREGGVIDEILVENLYRNPDGNSLIFDTVILEKVYNEPNIQLLLNTAAYEVTKSGADIIQSVKGFCSQNSTLYHLFAPLFCDASGDGILGFLSGAAFRMGAEPTDEFDEQFAPTEAYGSLLGHSLYFYTKDVGRPVKYIPPSFALKDITSIPKYKCFNAQDQGCQLWWIEYGGRLDTIHDAETIKFELWRIVYGVWNHIKNSGEFPDAETLTLEWVGHISGKRESRRFEGETILSQADLVEQRTHYDAVSYGGWAVDLHPADGVFSELPSCNQWHMKGVYQIPYRAMFSRNIENLFLAGRLISASHVAFGSTRVMATCAHNAQAVGMAAAICKEKNLAPADIADPANVPELQCRLQRMGQFIPHIVRHDPKDLAQRAAVTASSTFQLDQLPPSENRQRLASSRAMLLPLREGAAPRFTLSIVADVPTELEVELRTCSRRGSFTPDVVVARKTIAVGQNQPAAIATPHSRKRSGKAIYAKHQSGGITIQNGNGATPSNSSDLLASPAEEELVIDFEVQLEQDAYAFLCVLANEHVSLKTTDQLLTGVMAVRHGVDTRVAENHSQRPPKDLGFDSFELWCPERRPVGRNFAIACDPPLDTFQPVNVTNGIARPTTQSNAWIASVDDKKPCLTLTWKKTQTISRIELSFDTDFDHAMESVLMTHPEDIMPQCVRKIRVLNERQCELFRCDDNHQTRRVIRFEEPIQCKQLHIELESPSKNTPAALFEVRCYSL